MEKKGLSEVIVTVIMIGLVLAAGILIYNVVNSLIKGKIQSSEDCFGNYGQLTINSEYTCYNTSVKEFDFSVGIGNINVSSVAIIMSLQDNVKNYKIPGNYSNVKSYGGNYGENLVLPGKNGAITYVTKDFTDKPESIKIAPIINGQQCDVSDTLTAIDYCI